MKEFFRVFNAHIFLLLLSLNSGKWFLCATLTFFILFFNVHSMMKNFEIKKSTLDPFLSVFLLFYWIFYLFFIYLFKTFNIKCTNMVQTLDSSQVRQKISFFLLCLKKYLLYVRKKHLLLTRVPQEM